VRLLDQRQYFMYTCNLNSPRFITSFTTTAPKSNLPESATMSYSSRPLASHSRQVSTSGSSAAVGQSPILLARINEKKAELENLKQLRDLSAALAGQMQMLEEKLATLSDGTEG
jgi:hypothetical protein